MPPKFCNVLMDTECLNTRFPLRTLLLVRYNGKLKKICGCGVLGSIPIPEIYNHMLRTIIYIIYIGIYRKQELLFQTGIPQFIIAINSIFTDSNMNWCSLHSDKCSVNRTWGGCMEDVPIYVVFSRRFDRIFNRFL